MYYVKLNTPLGTFYKIGYTSKSSLRERFAYDGAGDELMVDREFIFTYRKDAWDVEQTLLNHFGKYRAFGKYSSDPSKPLHRKGQSELFAFDVLGLDEELYKLTDAEREAFSKLDEQSGRGCSYALLGLLLVPFTLGISLFFIAGGLSEVFSGGSNKTAPKARRKPTHPPKIQALINELCTKSAASPTPVLLEEGHKAL